MPPSPVVPAIPPLSAIQDPNTRAVLQALINGWQVRNGDIGSGDNAFITAQDIPQAVNNYFTNANNATSGGGGGGGGGSTAPIIDAIIRDVVNSPEWNRLSEAIVRIETPDWLRDAMRTAQTNIARQVSTLAARLGDNEAGVGEERLSRVTLERALASYFRQISASYGGNVATGTDLWEAMANTAVAESSHVTQLTADVGEAKVTAEEALTVSNTLEGYANAAWTVKLESGKYVTGVTLGMTGQTTNPTSQFLVRADKFAVGNPTMPGVAPVIPFTVYSTTQTIDGVSYPAGVYMQNVYMDTAQLAGDLLSNNYVPNTSGWIIRKQARNDGAGNYIGEFYGDVLIGGRLTTTTVNQGVADTVTTGTTTLGYNTNPSRTITHNKGRPVLLTISPSQYWADTGEYVAFRIVHTNNSFTIYCDKQESPAGNITVTYSYL